MPCVAKALRTSTIYVATGEDTVVYRSFDDVPPRLRRKLDEFTSGKNSATILIADRRGRDEILRAIHALPQEARNRLLAAVGERIIEQPRKRRRVRVYCIGAFIALAITLLVWAIANLRKHSTRQRGSLRPGRSRRQIQPQV